MHARREEGCNAILKAKEGQKKETAGCDLSWKGGRGGGR